MNRVLFVVVLSSMLVSASCNPPPGVLAPPPSEFDRQMELAHSFEQSGDFSRAIHLYSIVAENAPGPEQGSAAALKTALLFCSPRNPSRSDVLALLWFRKTSVRTKSPDEQMQAEASIALLDRLLAQSLDAHRQHAIADSLQISLRRQSGTILSQTRRLQDMEREVAAARIELKKLRDGDLSGSRQGP